MNRGTLAAIVFGAGLAGAAAYYVQERMAGNDRNPDAGTELVENRDPGTLNGLVETLPQVQLPDRAGQPRSLHDWPGKSLVINFWATWCAPCVEEMPLLAGAAAQYRDAGLVVLLVDVGEETRLVEDFVAEHGLDLPVALDMNSETSYDYRVSGYPTSVLIDRAGRVVDVRRGAFSDGGDLRQALGLILP